MIEIRQYVDRRGRDPFGNWFSRLSDEVQARVTVSLDRLERGNFGDSKGVGAGISEMRLNFGPGYRIYFGKDGSTLVILLGGGSKKRQQSDIASAQTLWKEYKLRKREG